MKSQIIDFDLLPQSEVIKSKAKLDHIKQFFVIYDQNLNQYNQFRQWLKQFSFTYPVEAGEALKSHENFPAHMTAIIEKLITVAPAQTCFLAVGGGTVGDFSGFAASVYKRGVDLVHLPTTWLSAIDSAHGGKNALNVGSIKNQVGTFYAAKAVLLVRELLFGVSREQSLAGMGEMIKAAILDGRSFLKKLAIDKRQVNEVLWSHLHRAIKVKLSVVEKDPFEKKGSRQKLNLGHTLGHAIEAKFAVPHGLAVAQGLYFAIDWSLSSGLLDQADHKLMLQVLNGYFTKHKNFNGDLIGNFRVDDLKRLVAHDKKLVDEARLNFVFVTRVGRAEVLKVAINNLIQESVKQGWAV